MTTPRKEPPTPLDIALGLRIRLRRRELGLSQNDLGLKTDITFQQVQKYEHGINRVSFSRLVHIATALRCSVSELIGNLGAAGGMSNQDSTFDVMDPLLHRLSRPGVRELVENFLSLTPAQASATVRFVKEVAHVSSNSQ